MDGPRGRPDPRQRVRRRVPVVHDPACPCRKPASCVRRVHIPGAQQPVITEQTWAEFVRVRDARATTPPRRLGSPHVLSGLVRCAGCDRAMRVRPETSYRSQRLECPEPRHCPAPAGVVYRLVWDAVQAWIAEHPDGTRAALRASLERQPEAPPGRDRAALERLIARADKALSRLTVSLACGLVPEGAYAAARDELVRDRAQAEAGLADLPEELARGMQGSRDGTWVALPPGEHRAALRGLLVAVVIRRVPGRPSIDVTGRGAG